MMLTGSMTCLQDFYLSFGVLLAVPLTIYQVPLVARVAVWFRTHLGVAMGILQAMQGLGTVLAIPWSRCCSPTTVWPGHFGALAWWVAPRLLLRLLHNEPAQHGLRPLGAPPDAAIQRLHEGPVGQIRADFLRQAQRTGRSGT